VTRHQTCYGTIAAMTRQGKDPRRGPRRARAFFNFLFLVAGVVPLLDWWFYKGIGDAGAVAQVVSAPLAAFAAIGLAGTYKRFQGLHDPEPPAHPRMGKPLLPPTYAMAPAMPPRQPSKGSGAGLIVTTVFSVFIAVSSISAVIAIAAAETAKPASAREPTESSSTTATPTTVATRLIRPTLSPDWHSVPSPQWTLWWSGTVSLPKFNGVDFDSLFPVCWRILAGQTPI
jgi:hypothetical protein